MNNALKKAIFDYFAAGSPRPAFYTAVGGQFWFGAAPEGTTGNYAVLKDVSNVPANTFSETITDGICQIDCYVPTTAYDADDMAAKAKALFDFAILTVTGLGTVQLIPERDPLTVQNAELSGLWRWVSTIQYRYLLQAGTRNTTR